MKKIVSRALALIFCLFVTVNSPAQEIYREGNVRVVLENGWKIYHGDLQVAHGEGSLDMDNLPPAFKAIIDNYANTPVQKTASRAAQSTNRTSATQDPYIPVNWDKSEPLITVNWNQGAPFNQAFPTVNGTPTLVGCSTIATAQVLNFFRHCDTLKLSGRNQAYCDLQSPYFSDYEKNMDGLFYNYKYDLIPDFDKINADTAELSKFLFAVALAQHAYFDLDGTMTSIYTQRGALDNVFGYDYDLYEGDGMEIAIQEAIVSGVPVILNGNNGSSGHSFNADGFNGSEFHFNYGWGGYCDGWFLMTQNLFPEDMTAVVVHPSDGSRVKMQPIPASVRIYSTDQGNDYDNTFNMKPGYAGSGDYMQEPIIELEPGNYAFYFIYPDGSTIAPYLEDNAPLTKLHESVITYGKYITSPAQFCVGYKCRVDFWHSPDMGYIQVLASNFEDAEFKNFGVSLIMNGERTPLTYDAQRDEFSMTVDWTPGEYDFQFYVAKYDTTIGPAERSGEGPWEITYKYDDGSIMDYSINGWSSTYTDKHYTIILTDSVTINGQKITITEAKLKIYLNKYCDGFIKYISYKSDDPAAITPIKADIHAPAYRLNEHIIIIDNKKIYLK